MYFTLSPNGGAGVGCAGTGVDNIQKLTVAGQHTVRLINLAGLTSQRE